MVEEKQENFSLAKAKERITQIEAREKRLIPNQMWIRGMSRDPYNLRNSPTALTSFASRQKAKQEILKLKTEKKILKEKFRI